jgi:hypothetical protein
MNTLKIVMVGPRSVGKTSLLAGMYREMKPEVDGLHCTLWQDAPTAGLLNERRHELEELAAGEEKMVAGEVGTKMSADERSFTFGFVLNGDKAPTLSLCFTDLPGGWYEGKENHQKADEHLASSAFSLIAVDATALMEERGKGGPGRFNHQINQPAVIQQCYLRSMERLKENKHCVLFVLIRAESYSAPKDQKLMFNLLREAYEDLINDFRKNGIKAEATSVETVGGVRFSKFIVTNGKGTARFVRKRGHKYEPKGCEAPFRRILHHATDRALADKKSGFFGWLFDLFGGNKKLEVVVLKLTEKSGEKVEKLTT